MTAEEQPPPQTSCVVTSCGRAATVYVEVGASGQDDGETAVAMCDEHAANWREG